MQYYIFIIKYILGFLSYPIVTGIVLFFIAKYFWLDKFLLSKKVSKDLEVKEKVISKILLTKDKIVKYRFYYDRLVNTSQSRLENDFPVDKASELKELEKISIIINEDIPILLSEIDSILYFYFGNGSLAYKDFEEYNTSLKKINDFMIFDFPKVASPFKKIGDFKELNLDDFLEKMKKLLNTVKITNTFWLNN